MKTIATTFAQMTAAVPSEIRQESFPSCLYDRNFAHYQGGGAVGIEQF